MLYEIMILLCFAVIIIKLFMLDLVMFIIYLFRNLIIPLPNFLTFSRPLPLITQPKSINPIEEDLFDLVRSILRC